MTDKKISDLSVEDLDALIAEASKQARQKIIDAGLDPDLEIDPQTLSASEPSIAAE